MSTDFPAWTQQAPAAPEASNDTPANAEVDLGALARNNQWTEEPAAVEPRDTREHQGDPLMNQLMANMEELDGAHRVLSSRLLKVEAAVPGSLSRRDHFAIASLNGLIFAMKSAKAIGWEVSVEQLRQLAETSWRIADAMEATSEPADETPADEQPEE